MLVLQEQGVEMFGLDPPDLVAAVGRLAQQEQKERDKRSALHTV